MQTWLKSRLFCVSCECFFLGIILTVSPALAHASALLGSEGQVFATGGDIIVDVLPGTTSDLSNNIRIFPSYPNLAGSFLIGVDGHSGTVNLADNGLFFSAGQELVFGIDNHVNQFPSGILFSGPSSRNFDGNPHVIVLADTVFGDGVVESWRINFEDIPEPGGQFNDAFIRVRQLNPIPEPSTALLLGLGLLGFAARRRA